MKSLPNGEGKVKCDETFIRYLAETYGFPRIDVQYALEGETTQYAEKACKSLESQLEYEGTISPRRRGERLDAWARQYSKGRYRHSTRVGPTGGKTVTPKQGERWPKFSNEQIERNLERFLGGV